MPFSNLQSSRYTKYVQTLEEITTEAGDHVLESFCRIKICRKKKKTQCKIHAEEIT